MLTFMVRGTVADVDSTITTEPLHPTTVLLVEADGTFTRVILPPAIAHGAGD